MLSFQKAINQDQKPSLIILKTHIAFGSPNKQDSEKAHGAPLGKEEIRLTKKKLGWTEQNDFIVPPEVLEHCRKCIKTGAALESEWQKEFKSWKAAFPDLGKQWDNDLKKELPKDFDKDLPVFHESDDPIATRAASGKALNALASKVKTLMGGSADLAPSNKTYIENEDVFQKSSYHGRNIRFGVREHAMGAIVNGMSLHESIRPYCGTFLVFSDYMRPAIRVACLMKLPIIYIFTHDSIGVGEDGPTHQPVEHLASLRAIPGLTVIRPADANETVEAWQIALKNNRGPTALILSRQKLPIIKSTGKVKDGGYILSNTSDSPDIILIGSGSEVSLILKAKKVLGQEYGIKARVVSMPSWELFEEKDSEYKESVLSPSVKTRLVVEAGIGQGWERYIGLKGRAIVMESFGLSGPSDDLMEKFGFTVDNIVRKSIEMVKQ